MRNFEIDSTLFVVLFGFGATAHPVGQDLPIPDVSRSHTMTHHSR